MEGLDVHVKLKVGHPKHAIVKFDEKTDRV
jgi:hypothetical protein